MARAAQGPLTRKAIANRDGVIAERDRAIAERDRAIRERDEAIAERDQVLKSWGDTGAPLAKGTQLGPYAAPGGVEVRTWYPSVADALAGDHSVRVLRNMALAARIAPQQRRPH